MKTQVKEKQNIPKGWKVTKLGDIVSVTTGSRDANHGSPDGAYPFFTCAQKVSKINDYSFDTEAVLIAGNGDFNVKYYKGKFDAYQRTYVLSDFENTTGAFIFHKAKQALGNIVRNNQGSSVKFIKKGDLTDYELFLPPVDEQEKIAEVLGAVDVEIEKTKEVIKATEKLKKGLMQKLFTQGIGHKKFKQAELGEIPESWKVVKIQELIDGKIILENQDGNHGGDHPKSKEYVDEGIPFISAADVRHGRVDLEECHFLPKERTDKLRIGFAHEGDVLLTHKGSVGNVAIVPKTEYPYLMLTPQVTYFRVDSKKIVNSYLAYIFESSEFQKRFKAAARQSTRDFLSITNQRQLKIAFTSDISEQEKIAEILTAVDEKIAVNKKLLAKQTELKKGLMQDLLSGIKRVNV